MQITSVMAVSLDGRIGKHSLESDADRREYSFTNEDDRQWVARLLAESDAIVTGANSLRASGGTWQVKNDRGRFPAWIVLSNSGLDEKLPFWDQKNVDRVLVSSNDIQGNFCETKGVDRWILPSQSLAKDVVEKLQERNWTRVLLFGGGVVNNLFYENGLVDFARITLCPLIIGTVNAPFFVSPGLSQEVKMTLVSSVTKGNLLFLHYKIQK